MALETKSICDSRFLLPCCRSSEIIKIYPLEFTKSLNSLLRDVLTPSVQPVRLLKDPRRFFVDRLQISFLKLRILTFPFSKDTNWIIGAFTGAALESGWSAQLFKTIKKIGRRLVRATVDIS